MIFLRQILFTLVMLAGFSLAASAQRQPDDRKKPKKDNAEIKPENKKPKNNDNNNNNRNNDNRGKKPQTFFLLSENKIEINKI